MHSIQNQWHMHFHLNLTCAASQVIQPSEHSFLDSAQGAQPPQVGQGLEQGGGQILLVHQRVRHGHSRQRHSSPCAQPPRPALKLLHRARQARLPQVHLTPAQSTQIVPWRLHLYLTPAQSAQSVPQKAGLAPDRLAATVGRQQSLKMPRTTVACKQK